MSDSQAQKPKVVLHWLEKSRSQRILWLLQECKGLDWEVKTYKRQPNMLAPPALKEVHPLGKSPVITVEAPALSKPMVVAESAAICEYLCDHFAPHLVPKRYKEGQEGQVGGETEEWLRYRFYMHYAEGSLMTLLLLTLFMDNLRDGPQVPWFIKPVTKLIVGQIDSFFLKPNHKTHFSFLDSEVASSPNGGQYLCGTELTAADILMSFPLIAGKGKIDRQEYPKLTAYMDRLEGHKGYKESIKKIEEISGEPFKAML
ncbi:hypothetical protein KC327_g6251 [Hortaea werneckii]|uniref:GST N-terminal domain-containing protein n=1 Tax=Hortaea werneckii EXF-2000 TaxID=1157616 RepID=A0A1Z5TFG9_HORWE|nr:hypothetical protein KC358_g12493 [Hortaea werneckii]OTA34772.1 hypothetical protein BTJ68_06040 [Hortaea werneckii EXF-2000]KAI6811698.1 hypothetical protein KC350_g12119 [Hortaea werneckii]KAI6912644.1 hypothetical protein KC348_g12631 [Hortaea werneckii]KAI6927180.1 hypothetical protein KC341_g12291 [Hortaea werneckii]